MSAAGVEWECFDIFFGFPEVRKLVVGLLDEDAEHVFTSGHCHSFAEALTRLSGAELIFAFDDPPEGEDRVQGHVMARIEGRCLDARGWLADPPESQWQRVREIGPQGWLAFGGGWLEPRVTDALPYAGALLRRLRVPIASRPGVERCGQEAAAAREITNHRPRRSP